MLGVFLSTLVYMRDKDAVDTHMIILCGIALELLTLLHILCVSVKSIRRICGAELYI